MTGHLQGRRDDASAHGDDARRSSSRTRRPTPPTLHAILRASAARTWDQLSVDGDTSTNDTVFLLASGAAGGGRRGRGSRGPGRAGRAVEAVARDTRAPAGRRRRGRDRARDLPGDRRGRRCGRAGRRPGGDLVARWSRPRSTAGTRTGAGSPGRPGNATVAAAPILEAAGLDAATAAARAGAPARLDPDALRIAIAGHLVYDGRAGGPVEFDKGAASAAMAGDEVLIRLDLGLGDGSGEAFGCDLTEAVRPRELGVHDVTAGSAAPDAATSSWSSSGGDDARRPAAGARARSPRSRASGRSCWSTAAASA